MFAFVFCITNYAGFDGIELSKTSVNATVGDTIAVNIMPKANPMPVFSVTKSGSANSTVGIMTNRTFTLEAVQMSDTGIYALKAENLAGSETAEVNITVEAKVDEDGELMYHQSVLFMHSYNYILAY